MLRMKWVPLLAGLVMIPSLAAAQATADALARELARCRAVADAAARLKCYDLIVPGEGAGSAAAATTTASATAASATAGGAASPPAAAGPATAAAAARFGLEHLPMPGANDEVRSSIPGRFTGWEAKTRWRLANGQVWQVADGSRAYYQLESPAVRITRGALGSFFMEISGVSHAVPVRRVE
jgi:hypothetical protein